MKKTPNGWTILDEDAGVLTYEYTFAPGANANAFAARMANGEMLVISAPKTKDAGVFDDLLEFGEVGAIVANTGFHHLGLPGWKERFPEARFFADGACASRIAKKNKDAPPLEPMSELVGMLGDEVSLSVLDNTKIGELWARVRTKDGYIWFASDTLSNLPELPSNFFLRQFFKFTGTKAGFGVFQTALGFMVKDKKQALRQLQEELSTNIPCTMVVGHGPFLAEPGIAERTKEVIAAAL